MGLFKAEGALRHAITDFFFPERLSQPDHGIARAFKFTFLMCHGGGFMLMP